METDCLRWVYEPGCKAWVTVDDGAFQVPLMQLIVPLTINA